MKLWHMENGIIQPQKYKIMHFAQKWKPLKCILSEATETQKLKFL